MGTNQGHILVVDDERLNRVLLSTNLQESGYEVDTAEDGQQALELLRAQAFDVVLLDLLMPRMDGYQVLEQIRSDDALRRIPVIVISSMDDMDSIVRCIEMGATDYLHKPFNPALLHARLRGSLAGLREERLAILRLQLAQVTATQEEERKRIAQELHDGLGPNLASLSLRLHAASKSLHKEGRPLAAELKEMGDLAQGCIQDVRRLIYDLRPVALDELGLVPALREYLNRSRRECGLAIQFADHAAERLPAPVETALFRLVQEAMNNIVRHAAASQVDVTLEDEGGQVILRIADDGRGFDPQAPRSQRHLGLWSMRERVEQLGGTFEIESAPGQGTVLSARVPL